ncbi:ATP synthase F1 subunit gamma [uncultured Parolsenella sp.]|uniref:ATP synthase F1 subunit gamma n=1 Tax=uncultured Parolsenella sp. TaxID=2083008 RepID=UPI0027DD6900|nr:ATP synthase F1 subunit gamma [uncultured Parolsenella sp.]
MSNLRDLSRRIDSITNTRQITRTMEMVSTARVGEALERASSAAPYKDAIKRMLAEVANSDSSSAQQPLLQVHESEDGVLFILIASDRGLAGGFNITLQRDVESRIRKLRAAGKRAEVITCGTKPTDYFRYRGIKPVLSFTGISAEPTTDEAMRIASFVIDGFVSGGFDRVDIVYNHARNRVQQEVVDEQLLPVDKASMVVPAAPRTRESLDKVEPKEYTDFLFDPSPARVLGYLMPAYIRTVIHHALLDSAAAEHGARRRAMKAATDNANEAITTLNRTYNRIRQGSITTELNEIIGGASALEDN